MTDLELTKACALAMGYRLYEEDGAPQWASESSLFICDASERGYGEYGPLRNDAQAMALMKRFRLDVEAIEVGYWQVTSGELAKQHAEYSCGGDESLNRAVCLCVAALTAAASRG